MTGLPAWVSTASYDAAQGRDDGPEPEYAGPDAADLAALQNAHDAMVAACAIIAAKAWTYDFTSTCNHADFTAEMRDYAAMIGHAVAEAKYLMRDGGVL